MWEKQYTTVTNMLCGICLKVTSTVRKIPIKVHPEGTSLNYKTGIQDKEEGSLSGGSSSPLTVEEADALLLW